MYIRFVFVFSQNFKEFMNPCISFHATVWHPAVEHVLLNTDHLFFPLLFCLQAIFETLTSLSSL